MQQPLLKLSQVSVVRDGRTILGPLDLQVARGGHTAILGPNGSGKSTLLNLLMGEIHPFAGQGWIEILGKRCEPLDSRRRAIGFASPELEVGLLADFSVQDMVYSGLIGTRGYIPSEISNRLQIGAVAAAMGRFGLGEMARRKLSSLSVGERRRVTLARAFVARP